jgi:hypothetical protein
MNQITAMCGLICSQCDAFIATLNDSDEKRAEVARLWSEQYNTEISPADINCLGCTSDSDCLFNHCRVCEIRKCAKEKQIVNCGYCDDYACGKLEAFFQMVPDAKKQLDEVRAGL